MIKFILTSFLAMSMVTSAYAYCPPAWDSSKSYQAGDYVTLNETTYEAQRDVTQNTPPSDSDDWFWTSRGTCVSNSISFTKDVGVGNYWDQKDLSVTGNTTVRSADGINFGVAPTSWGKMTTYQMEYFIGAEGGMSTSKVNVAAVEVDNSSTMYSSKTKLSAGELKISDSGYGGGAETTISYSKINTPELTLNGKKLLQLAIDQQKLINSLRARLEALEQQNP